jgi:hypothetical protein
MVVWLVVLPAALGARYAIATRVLDSVVLGIDMGLFAISRLAYRDLRPEDRTMYDERHNAGYMINGYSAWTGFLVVAAILRALGVWRP